MSIDRRTFLRHAVAGLAAPAPRILEAHPRSSELRTAEAGSHWLRELTIPLRTLDPADPDYSDLAPLKRMVGNARVVCIGESNHHLREFLNLRHRITRFLVRELGFTAFAMESGFPEGLIVNEWIQGGEGDVDLVRRSGITYGFGECDEVREQLQWMHDWNTGQPRKLEFYGLDVGGESTSPWSGIEACLQRISPEKGDSALLALADFGAPKGRIAHYAALSLADRQRLTNGIEALVERARVAGNEIAYRCALSTKCLDDYMRGNWKPHPDWNPRDEWMADNVRWMLARQRRIIVAAHNGHVQRWPASGWGITSAPTCGLYLAPTLGREMVVIGTTYASGEAMLYERVKPGEDPDSWAVSYGALPVPPPDTIDALMDSAGLPIHMLDLRRVPVERLAGATAIMDFNYALSINPKRAFDVLIHVHHVTPVAGAVDVLRKFDG